MKQTKKIKKQTVKVERSYCGFNATVSSAQVCFIVVEDGANKGHYAVNFNDGKLEKLS